MKVVEFYGFDISELKEVYSYENFVYQVNHENQEYYLRISHGMYNSLSQIHAEIEWIHYLKINSVEVVNPVRTKNESYVAEVKSDEYTFYCVLFEKIEGENFTENLNLLTNDRIQQWGKLVGKLHILSKDYKIRNQSITRLHLEEDPLLANLDDVLKDFPKILELSKKVMSDIMKLPRSDDVYGLIHRDLHEANLIIHGNSCTYKY